MLQTSSGQTAARPRQQASTGRGWSFELGGIGKVVCGAGRLAELGELARELGGRRALLVSDPGLVAAGHAPRAAELLRTAGLEVAVFSQVDANPTTAHVDAGVEEARRQRSDLIVAVGGGSAMDCAKGINFLYTNGGRMEDYWGKGKAHRPMLPSIGVPTTAGTGSEAQSFALISQLGSHRKMACGDEKARFRRVILDPELLSTAPRRVRALSGLDAISHAVESHVTRARNPLSTILSAAAYRRLADHFETYLDDAGDLEAASEMLLGAHLAGAAIELSMLGAAHACANPLTARFGVEHGCAVAMMLPSVVRFNGSRAGGLYDDLEAFDDLEAPEALARRLEGFNRIAALPTRLRESGVEEADLSALAADAAEQWTGQHNPVPLGRQDFEDLYRGML